MSFRNVWMASMRRWGFFGGGSYLNVNDLERGGSLGRQEITNYSQYLCAQGPKFTIDEAKVKWEERFDGKWVLQTDLEEMTAEETALQYKQLWMVEEMFRTVKTLLQTRPIFHKCDETIRGHVFCSFLALLLRKELQDRLEAQGDKPEWAELLCDLESLQYTEVENQGKRFLLRSDLATTTAAVFRATGVAIPVSIQKIKIEE